MAVDFFVLDFRVDCPNYTLRTEFRHNSYKTLSLEEDAVESPYNKIYKASTYSDLPTLS